MAAESANAKSKSAKGGKREGAGRPSGSKNLTTVAREARLDEVCKRNAYDPFEALVKEARDEKTPQDIRIAIHEKLMRYRYLPIKEPIEDGEEAGGNRPVRLVIV